MYYRVSCFVTKAWRKTASCMDNVHNRVRGGDKAASGHLADVEPGAASPSRIQFTGIYLTFEWIWIVYTDRLVVWWWSSRMWKGWVRVMATSRNATCRLNVMRCDLMCSPWCARLVTLNEWWQHINNKADEPQVIWSDTRYIWFDAICQDWRMSH